MNAFSPTGFEAIPQVKWGSHLAHFFDRGDELRDLLAPYFKAGLENNERCLWVTGAAFSADEARTALRAIVPDLDQRERDRQIEIANFDHFYAPGEKLNPAQIVAGLVQREQDALRDGYEGLRTNGNCAWVKPDDWRDFLEYERLVHKAIRGRRMICMCSYCDGQLRNGASLQVMEHHDLVLPTAPRLGAGAMSTRTFNLAMVASDMGTWRYTLADDVCEYDVNAQRLYGLTEARFLHNKANVQDKFHADDLDLMWSRVAKALDTKGDGRYEVEYRVKQPDGSWRWLSAWGLVEFEGDGPDRKPVAISGASRDLTTLKQAEDLQRLLLNELNHRIKNTFATIQAIAAQTLRTSQDLPSAREALDRRIRSLAQAHDLLTVRSWTGANLTDIVMRALDAFTPTQVTVTGTPIEVSPKHALAFSMALHELATNAVKYGALSRPAGRIRVQWHVNQKMLHLNWEESGGPPVSVPTQRGFGSRLLEEVVVSELGGHTNLAFNRSGVSCLITAAL